MLTLAVLRHASTAWNERGLMQGRRDEPLSASGRSEAARWRVPDSQGADWLSSPLRRAVETAELMGAAAPHVEPALIEMDWGRWEGCTLDELLERHGATFVANQKRGLDFRPSGGESPREVMVRVQAWLEAMAARGRPGIAVTHNGVIRALLALATGWDMTDKPPVRLQAACAHRFAVGTGGRLAVVRCNIPLDKTDGAGAVS